MIISLNVSQPYMEIKATTKLPIIPNAIILILIAQKINIKPRVMIKEVIITKAFVGKDLGKKKKKSSVNILTIAARIPITPSTLPVDIPINTSNI